MKILTPYKTPKCYPTNVPHNSSLKTAKSPQKNNDWIQFCKEKKIDEAMLFVYLYQVAYIFLTTYSKLICILGISKLYYNFFLNFQGTNALKDRYSTVMI